MRVVPTLDKSRWSLWRMEQAEYDAGEPSNVVYGSLDKYDIPSRDWDMSEIHGVNPLSEISSRGKNYEANYYEPRISSTRLPRKRERELEKAAKEEVDSIPERVTRKAQIERLRNNNNSYIASFKSDDDERKEAEKKARRNKYLVEW